ncbi:hypothetical protein LTR64_005869 [Lithohypha guttulata]|uniref:uncharacterized protein n=1 Tax=Lithohypha guttulata TaxID=1690604 RepID=UPI00315D5670
MSFTSQDSTASNETFGKDASFKLPQLIGAMSISPAGRDVVLASKEGLHIIDLDSPYFPPRFLPHRTPWEVADVQWSPFADRDYWVVSTSNQKALVWNLNAYGWRNSIEHVLHGHTRAITDINFSAFHPDKLATCAVDSFIHCWDLRYPGRPAYSFSDWFAGATQVKWSRQDEHVVASSHDKFLHIWDDRNGARPLRTIKAHDTKIYGIDWNRFEPSEIVTCSLDRTIKLWNTNKNDDVPERVIETSFPVWRARHTPFGWGLMVMPQRGNGNLHLYDRRAVHGVLESGPVKPVHIFQGHKGQVKEFLWRGMGDVKNGTDFRDFQLVSWGTDQELRLHAVSKDIFEDIGYERGVSRPQRLRFTRRGARYKTFRDEPTEHDSTSVPPARADSFPASNQFLRVRGRPSTNMGMSRVPIAHFKGWLHAGKASRRTDMHGRGAGRPNTDPIAWMKSVKITSWDPDALADEITMVGEKFEKVNFETVDVSQRRATMALQSPWGESDNVPVYTRLQLRFPKGYPKDVQAIVHVQKTNSITSDVQKRLSQDIHQITAAYKLRGRGCIEAIVRFLLRDQSLDQILTWINRDSLTDSKLIEAAEAQLDGLDDSDDDPIEPASNVPRSDAQINVPLAKRCAALWAENGKLVCFFKLTDKEPASLLSAMGTGHLDEPETSKLFGGFGKFQVDSPSRKSRAATQSINDESDSDTSDQASVLSSDTSSSESSGDFRDRDKFVPWQRNGTNSLRREKSTEGSQKSGFLDTTREGDLLDKTVVSIHDLEELIPASKKVAEGYIVSSDMAKASQHNCGIATRHGRHDTSMMWRLSNRVVTKMVAHEADLAINGDTRSTVPNHLSQNFRESELYKQYPHTPLPTGSARAFGENQLLPTLFQFCEKTHDIQMLATFSAIWLSSQLEVIKLMPKFSSDMRHWMAAGSSPSKTDDHGVDSKSHGPLLSGANTSVDRAVDSGLNILVPALSVNDGQLTGPSSGATSIVAQDRSGPVSAVHSNIVSLAGSPENSRFSRRSESSVLFSAATATFNALTRSRPPSPPARLIRQGSAQGTSKSLQASPDDSYFNESKSKLRSLGPASISTHGDGGLRAQHIRSRLHPILKNNRPETSISRPTKKRLKTKLAKPTASYQQQIPLLVSQDLEIYENCLSYIEQYIPLLEVWQLWVQRAEMVKIRAQVSALLDKPYQKRGTQPSQVRHSGLEMRRCCPRCGHTLAPIEKNGMAIGWHCISQQCSNQQTTKPPKRQRCAICEVVTTGLTVPCLQCGHLTCYDCASEWFMEHTSRSRIRISSISIARSDTTEAGDRDFLTCPTGCGCDCQALSAIDVPVPKPVLTDPESEVATAPTTPRSEGYQDSASRFIPTAERRKTRGQSIGAMTSARGNSAMDALLALNKQAGGPRHRATSSTSTAQQHTQDDSPSDVPHMRTRDNSVSIVDELLPWASDVNATLGRGFGAGLSRGLSNRSSNATIRKVSRRDSELL